MNSTEISDIIKSRMTSQGLSLAMLAERIAMPENVIASVLSGNAKLPLECAQRLAEALDMGMAEIASPLLRQHFNRPTVDLLHGLCSQEVLTDAERQWLSLLRQAAPGALESPSRFARRLLCALVTRDEVHN
jgi:transcriptional regulator with XRE-family HTH domain